MKVLAIGNSFSQDATRYLHQIALADGYDLKVVNLDIGGCSLERHHDNITYDRQDYSLEVNGHATGRYVSIREALLSDTWDFVTLQQVSHLSFDYSTYQPYLAVLSDYVRKYAPTARQLIHQTWAYEEGSEKLAGVGYRSQKDMFEDLKRAYDKAAQSIGARLIPCGEAMQRLSECGIGKVHRDGFHAGLGLARYMLGAVWYECLTGRSIENNSFRELDEYASGEELAIAKRCAHEAVMKYSGS
ncbi:MAG TPA: DUF4886 domain-containing protein [Candidatus Atribacteria bacterium]|nr:DUF4886 domain-containing protein [Candidatus Atribacteria bacterium]HPT78002.1 DUF4886 domain-containing protein [Candidatus Atribacteria bacterium]